MACNQRGMVLVSVLLILAVLVRLRHGAPILFRQTRPGYQGRLFTIYKFRSMRELQDAQGNALPDELRVTRLGQIMRSTSLDELPELINILKGEMSLVGPRPLLVEYLPRYSPEQARRHEVLPGMTGWAQINGRNVISWEEKFKLDVWYVDNWSLWLDIKIILTTLWKALIREGISQEGHISSEVFMGTDDNEIETGVDRDWDRDRDRDRDRENHQETGGQVIE